MQKKSDVFVDRHIGPGTNEIKKMLDFIGAPSLEKLIDQTVPAPIRMKGALKLDPAQGEFEALASLRKIAVKNENYRSFIGMGYSDCITPPVIQRNILENPGWYTQYTPYQAEIAQGRLEALLNFQTMISDMTGLPISNASMLDEATAAAEAMALCHAVKERDPGLCFFVSELCHPQTIDVVRTRARPLGIQVVVGDHKKYDFSKPTFGALLQYPATDGAIYDYREFICKAHGAGALAIVAADLLSLALLASPAELGADIAVGSSQRFGVPLGYGGPHAAFLATKEDYKRLMPGRLVGASKDVSGKLAIRLALQTREQHIRRDKATSNICTAQVLLAVIASMYAVYHGPEGITAIAREVKSRADILAEALKRLGYSVGTEPVFDTLRVNVGSEKLLKILDRAKKSKINLRVLDERTLTVALDEAVTREELAALIGLFADGDLKSIRLEDITGAEADFGALKRATSFLTHPVFNTHRSETEMLRYLRRLESKDLSLTTSMIPLGSCTMKLNATAEMFPVTWPEFSRMHPFVPQEQAKGYREMLDGLSAMLSEITGFDGVSLQPNAGSQGEYAGLLVIKKYLEARGQERRDVCLIPRSAHGTNPASAAMAGLRVVVVDCDSSGNVSIEDLKAKAQEHAETLAALMVTYPSTHGVFEEGIVEICEIVHRHGGQVYMDGANMNAQVGLCRPGDFGADVCHLNLHKTFCIPHGGGGPGMGPIGVKKHLVPHLPNHSVISTGQSDTAVGAISAAPWGSASILPISWMYITMMGAEGLTEATRVAILNANYIAKRLDPYFPVLYQGKNGRVAHECILDVRHLKASTGVEVEDVAKRLMDYGFHAPTISFPVPGTIMVEPTESESLAEMDRFCEAMILIRKEIAEIEAGQADKQNNVLKNAPHTAETVVSDRWDRPYSREKAAFPAHWLRAHKFWPAVGRINNVLGDRQLICSCPPIEEYAT